MLVVTPFAGIVIGGALATSSARSAGEVRYAPAGSVNLTFGVAVAMTLLTIGFCRGTPGTGRKVIWVLSAEREATKADVPLKVTVVVGVNLNPAPRTMVAVL